MGLEFRGFLAEGAFNAFTQLELCPRQGAFEIGEPIPSKVLEFGDKGLELFNVLSQVVDRKSFRPRPLRFCACHSVEEV